MIRHLLWLEVTRPLGHLGTTRVSVSVQPAFLNQDSAGVSVTFDAV